MSTKSRGLGRGLSVLLNASSQASLVTEPAHTTLPCHQLVPGKYQPRSEIIESTLTELADSIKKQGLIQPIVVRKDASGQYEIIAGERRWRASQLAGLVDVPVIIRDVDDEAAMAIALIENLQREDLNAIEEARAMLRLTNEFGLTHQQVADLLSKSRAAVSNLIRLLQLHSNVIQLIENGDIDMGHARTLLILEPPQQLEVAKHIIAKGLSVREAEALVGRVKAGRPIALPQSQKLQLDDTYQQRSKALSTHLQTKISIKPRQNGQGKIIIHYQDEAKLEALLKQMEASWG